MMLHGVMNPVDECREVSGVASGTLHPVANRTHSAIAIVSDETNGFALNWWWEIFQLSCIQDGSQICYVPVVSGVPLYEPVGMELFKDSVFSIGGWLGCLTEVFRVIKDIQNTLRVDECQSRAVLPGVTLNLSPKCFQLA